MTSTYIMLRKEMAIGSKSRFKVEEIFYDKKGEIHVSRSENNGFGAFSGVS